MMRYFLILALVLSGCSTLDGPRLPDTKNRVVDIVNTSGEAVLFSARNAERRGLARPNSFESDVAAQFYLTVNFEDGTGACLFDFRAEFANGETSEANMFDVCTEGSWVVKP